VIARQENELWDKESNHSVGSWVPPQKLNNEGYAQSATASIYGRETFYEPSQHNMNMGMAYPSPPEYQSGRNTPYGANGYNSSPLRAPMSEAGSLYQPAPTRPSTNYLDMPVPLTGSPDQLGGPSNMDLERAVNDLLRGADLNSVTKREIRRQLEQQFGMDLASRKATINAAIDRALLSHAG
jgi:chitin synthase